MRKLGIALALVATVALGACSSGSTSESELSSDSGGTALEQCVIGSWIATDQAKRSILEITNSTDATVSGIATLAFTKDGGIAYYFDELSTDVLSSGASGTKSISGTIAGKYQIDGETLITTDAESDITITVNGTSQQANSIKPSNAAIACGRDELTIIADSNGQKTVYTRQ